MGTTKIHESNIDKDRKNPNIKCNKRHGLPPLLFTKTTKSNYKNLGTSTPKYGTHKKAIKEGKWQIVKQEPSSGHSLSSGKKNFMRKAKTTRGIQSL